MQSLGLLHSVPIALYYKKPQHKENRDYTAREFSSSQKGEFPFKKKNKIWKQEKETLGSIDMSLLFAMWECHKLLNKALC